MKGDGGELRSLLVDGHKLCSQACRGPLSAKAAASLCQAALTALESAIPKALPPPKTARTDRLPHAARARSTPRRPSTCWLLRHRPLQNCTERPKNCHNSSPDLHRQSGAFLRTRAPRARVCGTRCARALAPACAATTGDQSLALIDGVLSAAFAALDDQVVPAPEPLARCAAWLACRGQGVTKRRGSVDLKN